MKRLAVSFAGAGVRRRLQSSLLWACGLLLFPALIQLLYPGISSFYLPTYAGLALGIGACGVMAWIRNDLNRLIAHAWMAWFFIGCLNSISSYMLLGPHYRPFLQRPTIIYFAFAAAMFVGMVVVERMCARKEFLSTGAIRLELKKIDLAALMVFCIAWGATLIAYAGYVPILSGFDITESIYVTNYGPIYGLGLVLVVAAVALFIRATQIKQRRLALLFGGSAILFVTAISFLDGKRYIAILIVLGCSFALLKVYGAQKARALLATFLSSSVLLYLLVFVVRQGVNLERYGDGWLSATFIAGVEFRDFAYSVARYEPGTIPEFSWASSALGSMVNDDLLALLGLSKQALVDQGSAFAWAKLFHSLYGIRTGIVSELWFAYGWLGLVVVLLIGSLTSRVAIAISRAKTDKQLVNRCVILALLTSLIMGQSTSITGSITVLLYVNVALYFWHAFFRISNQSNPPRSGSIDQVVS